MCNPIFTVSEFSSHELQRYFSIPPEKIRVVYPGCDHLADIPPDDKILKRAGLETGKFVLAVSSQSTVKNFHGLSQAWAMLRRLDMKLAIAGRNHTALFRDGNESITENVVMLGYVSDPELRSLYENASLFVYPSFYEGFGIPPVEAMSCGCPVLVARIPSLMEACGDAAVFCDPADISDIAENIARLLDDSALAKRLRESGFRRASQLTAARTAATLWSEIQSFI
jgi:glycosyltransferase involved in cell wall biosynthesis